MDSSIDVKALRKRLGWNQSQLANHLGVDRATVSRLEGGQPPHGSTRKLLDQLAEGVTAQAIDDRPQAPPSEAAE